MFNNQILDKFKQLSNGGELPPLLLCVSGGLDSIVMLDIFKNMSPFGFHRGWAVVIVIFLSAALAIGASNYAFGLFVEPLADEFGWTRTYISASLSFMALGSITSPFM